MLKMLEFSILRKLLLFSILYIIGVTMSYGQGLTVDTTKIDQAEVFYRPNEGGLTWRVAPDSSLSYSNTMGDLLTKHSSAFVNSNGVSGLQSISLRGTGSNHTNIYWNGLSLNSPTLGMMDMSTVSVGSANDIEIHYGASGLVDGSGGLGGSIQLNDYLKYDTLLGVRVQTGFGSFARSYRNLQFEWSDNLWVTNFSLAHIDAPNVFAFVDPTQPDNPSDTLRNAGLNSLSLKTGIGYRWNDVSKVEFKVWYSSSHRELPKSITSADFGEDYQEDKSTRGLVQYTRKKNSLKQQLTLGVIDEQLNYVSSFTSKVKTRSLQGNYGLTWYANNHWKIKTSLECNHQEADSDGFVDRIQQDKIAAMINPNWNWENWSFDFILRAEMYNDVMAPLMPSVLLNYRIASYLKIRGSVAQIYRHPTFNELYWTLGGNLDLNPEQGLTYDLGIDVYNKSEDFLLKITTYESKIDNWIIWLPETEAIYIPQNLFFVKSRGVEVNLNWKKRFSKKVKLNGAINYAFVETKKYKSLIDEDISLGKQLVYIPRNKASAFLTMEYGKRLAISYNYRFIDKRYITRDHSQWMPYYMLSDISLRYRFINMRFVDDINLDINNLLNKNYEVTPYQPMMQRNIMVSLRFNIEKQYEKK